MSLHDETGHLRLLNSELVTGFICMRSLLTITNTYVFTNYAHSISIKSIKNVSCYDKNYFYSGPLENEKSIKM